MNSRRKNDVPEYCVERQQVHVAKVLRLMKIIGIVLALVSAVCIAFAIHYSL